MSTIDFQTRGRMLSAVHSFILTLPKIRGYKSTLWFFFILKFYFLCHSVFLCTKLSVSISFEVIEYTKLNNLLPLRVIWHLSVIYYRKYWNKLLSHVHTKLLKTPKITKKDNSTNRFHYSFPLFCFLSHQI